MEDLNQETAKDDMIAKELGTYLLRYAEELKPDWNGLLESKSMKIVEEITDIIQGADAYPDDQQLVEDIMAVLKRNGISTGVCHDY